MNAEDELSELRKKLQELLEENDVLRKELARIKTLIDCDKHGQSHGCKPGPH